MNQSNLLDRAALEGTFLPSSVSWAQLDPGEFAVTYGVLNAAPLEISYRNMNLGFKGEAEIAPQKTMIGIVADPRTKARWFGTPADQASIASTRSTIDIRTEGAGSFYQITIDETLLARAFPASPDALALLGNRRATALTRDHLHAALLRSCVHRLFSAGNKMRVNALPNGLPLRIVSGTLIPLLAAAIDNLDRRAIEIPKSLTRRLAAVRACEAYMRDHVDAGITLLDLSGAAGMRSRSLINAFEAVTGFSPMDYLKRLRLHGVRRALAVADKRGTRVIDVATAWGFWHMGHFAADYRAMFGEAPSQTLLK
jgi:AraC family transcriptional regulator, ethanolamine operon transcriptional activator